MSKNFYFILAPWGFNGLYFISLTAENGNIIIFDHCKKFSKIEGKIKRITIEKAIEKFSVLDYSKPKERETIQGLIKNCNEESRDIYRFYGIFHERKIKMTEDVVWKEAPLPKD